MQLGLHIRKNAIRRPGIDGIERLRERREVWAILEKENTLVPLIFVSD